MAGWRAGGQPGRKDEPLYGDTYLPRKFKIGFVYEGDNTTDIYSHDLGFVAHFDGSALAGFTVLAGGGLGQSNGVRASHPRLADPIGFVPPHLLLNTARRQFRSIAISATVTTDA